MLRKHYWRRFMAGQRLPQTTPRFGVRYPCENAGVQPNDWNFRTALGVWLLSRLNTLSHTTPQTPFGKSATAPCGKQILDTESRHTTWPRSVRIGRLRLGRHLLRVRLQRVTDRTVVVQSPAITGIDFGSGPRPRRDAAATAYTHFQGILGAELQVP